MADGSPPRRVMAARLVAAFVRGLMCRWHRTTSVDQHQRTPFEVFRAANHAFPINSDDGGLSDFAGSDVPVFAGGGLGGLLETPGEMRSVGKSAGAGNLLGGEGCAFQENPGAFDPDP